MFLTPRSLRFAPPPPRCLPIAGALLVTLAAGCGADLEELPLAEDTQASHGSPFRRIYDDSDLVAAGVLGACEVRALTSEARWTSFEVPDPTDPIHYFGVRVTSDDPDGDPMVAVFRDELTGTAVPHYVNVQYNDNVNYADASLEAWKFVGYFRHQWPIRVAARDRRGRSAAMRISLHPFTFGADGPLPSSVCPVPDEGQCGPGYVWVQNACYYDG